jgi:hypothetical protein
LIGKITVDVDFEKLFATELAMVETESKFPKFQNIPWLQWLILGAPTVDGFSFDARRTTKSSRTGRGLMIELPEGLWEFRPARDGAQEILLSQIERNIEADVEKEIGEILDA